MRLEQIEDRYNKNKIWLVKRYDCGKYYINQKICDNIFNKSFTRVTKKYLYNIGIYKKL